MANKKTIDERVQDYETIRQEALQFYNTFNTVECPALAQKINFTSEGFNHLVYSNPKKMRDKRAQILRFDMLSKAKFILETSTTYQEYEEEIINKKINRKGSWVDANVFVRRWGLIAMVRKFRVKVVVIQEGNGSVNFLSVAPAWYTKQYRDIKIIETSVGKGLDILDDNEVLKNATVSDVH